MGVAHNIIERIQVAGKSILVVGCGPVGLFAVACAKEPMSIFLWTGARLLKLILSSNERLLVPKKSLPPIYSMTSYRWQLRWVLQRH